VIAFDQPWKVFVPDPESEALRVVEMSERWRWASAQIAILLRSRGAVPGLETEIARDILWPAGMDRLPGSVLQEEYASRLDNPPSTRALNDSVAEGFRQARDAGVEYGSGILAERASIRTRILLTHEIHYNVQRAEAALAEHPKIYQRAGRIVQPVRDVRPGRGKLERARGSITLSELATPTIRERLSEAAQFTKRTKDRNTAKFIETPVQVPNEIAEAIFARREHDARPLVGITEVPILRPDGTVLDRPGYDGATGYIYQASGPVPSGPENPTQQDALLALELLIDLVCDFPFKSSAHRSAALALFLTLVGRPAFVGDSPFFGIEAPDKGSGKGLLADVASMIAFGRTASKMPAPTRDEEWAKTILATLRAADPFVVLDNVTRLRSEALDSVLTARGTISGRLLGVSEKITIAARTVWAYTGNNVQIAGDLPRRILPIRIVAPEDAYTRTDFKRPNLLRYVEENRGQLVRACLTVLSAYCRAGLQSQGLRNFGSFEPWSDLVRSALVWLGLPDPCASRDEVEQVDEARETETAFFTALRVFAGSQETQKTSAEIHAIALNGHREAHKPSDPVGADQRNATALRAALYDVMGLDPAVAVPNAKAIGRHLSRLREKTRGGLRLVHNPDRDTKVARWFVTDKARESP
jgi:hypothetical protein